MHITVEADWAEIAASEAALIEAEELHAQRGPATCDVCRLAPEDSGAQYDMARITWHGAATVNVCSNCIHGNPISIVDLHQAVYRVAVETGNAVIPEGWPTP